MMNEMTGVRPPAPKDLPLDERLKVVLMDSDNLAMACGTAVLSISGESGIFWPDCPMPGGPRLNFAKAFALPDGSRVEIDLIALCPGTPPHYGFSVTE